MRNFKDIIKSIEKPGICSFDDHWTRRVSRVAYLQTLPLSDYTYFGTIQTGHLLSSSPAAETQKYNKMIEKVNDGIIS